MPGLKFFLSPLANNPVILTAAITTLAFYSAAKMRFNN